MTLKYARRRKALKKLKDPMIQMARSWKKATPLMKGAIVGGAVLPKAIILGAGYLAGKGRSKKKEQPKKYMAG